MTQRWQNGYKAVGVREVQSLWATRTDGRTLLVAGAGFDPRAPVAYECISAACPRPVDVVQVRLEALKTDPSTEDLALAGRERMERAVAESKASLVDHHTVDPTASTGMLIARGFFEGDYIKGYDEVIVDVSALPRSVFFPLVRGLLQMHNSREWDGQLHVVACDNPRIDRIVTGEGAGSPAALPGYVDREPTNGHVTKIWVPVLGEGESVRVDALREAISAEEVCPVLPFPSKDPRRGDDIVREYRELLFETMAVEPRNVIYASEANPFDLYRTLSRLNDSYKQTLSPLGETRMILSAHSSKLLSVGVLLTAFERGLEVVHVSPDLYTLKHTEDIAALAVDDLVVDLWLTGEPYA
jgi:hypothetical protein